ncbi:MAG: hypothetical protein AcusKO_04090 [Acuticoccus sp.]
MRTMSDLVRLVTRHPNAANLLMVMLLVLGAFSLANLTTRFWPQANLNEVEVIIAWPGASAADVETSILDAVEPAIRFITNVDTVRSFAREGQGFTSITFIPSADMQKAQSDVEQAVAGITTLPEDAEKPIVRHDRIRDPVAKIGIAGPFPEAALQVFARQIRDDLLDRGLDRVTIRGKRAREILVDAREHDLMRHDLTVADVASAIRQNSRDRPSGVLDGTVDWQIRVLGDAQTPRAIAGIVIKSLPSGEALTVGDVARVHDGFARGAVAGLRDGLPAIELLVERAPTADALESDAIVRAYLVEARRTLPQSLAMHLYDVRTERLQERISVLVRNGAQGLAIVLIVLFVFLRARIAFWVAAGIPVAFAGTLAVMLASGQSINMISRFALIMMLGVIVDDAIVVGEHTDTLMGRGLPPLEAAERGALDMLVPVMASSLTTIAAFAPTFMLRDVIGQMMKAVPLVAIAIIIASVIECFLILPGHLAGGRHGGSRFQIGRLVRLTLVAGLGAGAVAVLARAGLALAERNGAALPLRAWLTALPPSLIVVALVVAGLVLATAFEARRARRTGTPRRGPYTRLRAAFDRGFDAVRDGPFRAFVRATYALRYTTVALSVAAVMIVVYGLYLGGGHVRFVFFASPESEFATARVVFQPGTPRGTVVEGIAVMERTLEETAAALAPPGEKTIVDSYALIGRAGREKGDNLATISVQFTPSEARSVRTPRLVRAWQAALPDIAGLRSFAVSERRGGPPGRDVHLRLTGPDARTLKVAASDAIAALERVPGVSGVADNLPMGKPEVTLALTARGTALGFTAEAIGAQVRGAFEGEIARRLVIDEEEVPIRVRQRADGAAVPLADLFLRAPAGGGFVALTEIATLAERDTFSVIVRRDGSTSVAVTGDVDDTLTTPMAVTERVADTIVPALEATHGVRAEFGGRDLERRRSMEDLRQGAYLATITIYLILAFVFGCYWRPLVIMLIIPFGAVGAILGHVIMGINLSIVSFVGLLGLAGILVNDSIILVRRFDERLTAGETPPDAAIGASADRLRAVLLTSLTTIGGLTPLLFETAQSAQFLIPMAVTIVFGLTISTALVLILVPSLIGIAFDIGRIAAALIGRRGPATR